MFDLAFYNMISKCYKLLCENCKEIVIHRSTMTAKKYTQDYYHYINDNEIYIAPHITYFYPYLK